MSDATRKIGRTISNLVLSLFNATLILVVLCLWLAWNVVGTVQSIVAEAGGYISQLQPLRAEISGLKAEVSDLRGTLEAMPVQAGGLALKEVLARVEVMDERLGQASARLDAVAVDPTVLIDHAIGTAAARAQEGMAGLMACTAVAGTGG